VFLYLTVFMEKLLDRAAFGAVQLARDEGHDDDVVFLDGAHAGRLHFFHHGIATGGAADIYAVEESSEIILSVERRASGSSKPRDSVEHALIKRGLGVEVNSGGRRERRLREAVRLLSRGQHFQRLDVHGRRLVVMLDAVDGRRRLW
jgi:hypothetical protein